MDAIAGASEMTRRATHDSFPRGTEEMWDITAKALLRRISSARDCASVNITREELEGAAETECLIEMLEDGSLVFRIVGAPVN